MSGPGPIIEDLWRSLRAAAVRAVVPRNFEALPDRWEGDLDVLVHPADVHLAHDTIGSVAHASGLRLLYFHRDWNHHHLVFWRSGSSRAAFPEFLVLDLQTALGRKGFRYAPVEPFLEEPAEWKGVLVPRPPARATALALHVLLDKGRLEEKYRSAIQRDADSELEPFAASVLPAAAAARLAGWIRGGLPRSDVPALAAALRRTLVATRPSNAIFPGIGRGIRMLRYFGPRRGVLVALLGPDGAGKTTTLEATHESFPATPFPVRSVYLGKREPFLPSSRVIQAVFRRGHAPPAWSEGSASAAGGRAKPPTLPARVVRRILDLAGIANWSLEQWARYLVSVRPILQQDGLVLADRYAFDFAQRQAWSAAHQPMVARTLCRAFPIPDRTYLLWEDPAVLAARKDVSKDQAARLLERYRRIMRHIPNSCALRTDRTVADTAAVIAGEVAELLEARCPTRA